MMGPKRDATNIIYAAGAMLILTGLTQLPNDTALGVACLVMGPALIVQRFLLNRKRRAYAEKMSRIAEEQ